MDTYKHIVYMAFWLMAFFITIIQTIKFCDGGFPGTWIINGPLCIFFLYRFALDLDQYKTKSNLFN